MHAYLSPVFDENGPPQPRDFATLADICRIPVSWPTAARWERDALDEAQRILADAEPWFGWYGAVVEPDAGGCFYIEQRQRDDRETSERMADPYAVAALREALRAFVEGA